MGTGRHVWEEDRMIHAHWGPDWHGGKHTCETTSPTCPTGSPASAHQHTSAWSVSSLCPDAQPQMPRHNVKAALTEHMVLFCWFGPVVWQDTVLNGMLFITFHYPSGDIWGRKTHHTCSWFNFTFSNLRNKLLYYFTMKKKIAPDFCFTTSIKQVLLW